MDTTALRRTRVKICGIGGPEDARVAADAGADAVGLMMYEGSARFVAPQTAAAIASALPPFVTCVGVFVNAGAAAVRQLCRTVAFDLLQFHGDEEDDFCRQFGLPWIKAIRMAPGVDLEREVARFPHCRGVLVDARVEGEYGGTGVTFDWDLIAPVNKPLVLAGGLTPDNVAEAVRRIRPWAVDVSGGVELDRGIKDPGLMRQFIATVQGC